MNFCKCGLPLDRKWNKKYDEKFPGFCDKKCYEKDIKPKRVKRRKKYGLGGYVYDGYKTGDIFKKGAK